jgi:hypothetical protein
MDNVAAKAKPEPGYGGGGVAIVHLEKPAVLLTIPVTFAKGMEFSLLSFYDFRGIFNK